MQVENVKCTADRIISEISKIIVEKQNVLELMLVAMFSGGHVLLEDVPGRGKTTIAKALAKAN